MRLPFALAVACMAGVAHAAPDEDMLGRAEGYPICPPSLLIEPRCLVGEVSRRDEIYPSRKVSASASPRPWRPAAEPDIRYRYQGEDNGIDDYLARNRTTGLMIAKGDTILVERYQYDRTPQHRMTSHSMAKTVVAMLVGVALAEGSIRSLDDRAEQYVPQLRGTPYGETPIRHLLTMSSGIKFTEVYSGADDVALLARRTLMGESEGGPATVAPFTTRERPFGREFRYASGDTQVLGLVLRAATGKPLADYLSEKVWQPMGAEADATWLIDKGGYELGFSGLNATLRDYGRLGMLLANDGALNGRQIIPAGWVRAATTPSAPQFQPGTMRTFYNQAGLFGYGYQTWVLGGKEREFVLRGLRSQFVFVNPRLKLVLVHTAAGNVGAGMGEIFALWFAVTKRFAD
jgi:CubicO group peptidase (beta-lactamase class C family)